ncbi:MAG: hypothetical protein AVDCRST_MAG43-423 [uncultured Thermomicrobiales bacterium]|uniref:Uncharacterized protein n=1 Tax=uncultured Thermomicrobiales bacterium TaxID=1645740 RepID=A0A6J4UCR3_9BACT|nr:MAG: hypothetical protein AVDCRST_MAG43-423 [uncultured Thermomicrobiales bacterium]
MDQRWTNQHRRYHSCRVEIRDLHAPFVYFAAETEPSRLGILPSHTLRTAIHDPGNVEQWIEWIMDGRTTPIDHDYVGSKSVTSR